MAGLGFKDFAVGEVLTSADVDGYLMQQTVMRFADSGARGSALGTAAGTGVPLAEGMVAYLDDQNEVQVFDGSVWVAAGGLRQIVTGTTSTTTTISSTSYSDTTLSVSITPSSSSSRVLVIVSQDLTAQRDTNNVGGTVGLLRDASVVHEMRMASQDGGTFSGARSMFETQTVTFAYVDSPATTSSVTYKTQAKADSTANSGQVIAQKGSVVSTIVAIEVP